MLPSMSCTHLQGRGGAAGNSDAVGSRSGGPLKAPAGRQAQLEASPPAPRTPRHSLLVGGEVVAGECHQLDPPLLELPLQLGSSNQLAGAHLQRGRGG